MANPGSGAPEGDEDAENYASGPEDAPLLDEERACNGPARARRPRMLQRPWVVWAVAVGAVGALFTLLLVLTARRGASFERARRRNVILMISDGFGPAGETFARTYHQHLVNDRTALLPLDGLLVGSSRTQSASSLVTDSAAGATAFSCAIKTYNAAIGVDEKKRACGTVLEAAHARGLRTGLVVTSRVTHATPAAFSAHVLHRNYENDIALQQIGNWTLGRTVDLLFGGGRCEFLPNSRNESVWTERGNVPASCRNDSIDALTLARETYGWHILETASDLAGARTVPLPALGLFATDHMSYEIDRAGTNEPSLREMTRVALETLSAATKQSDHGYFLMVEGSRIDMAAHSNDPKTHYLEIMAYQETVALVRDHVARHPDTVLISVSDHETGGFALGRQLSEKYPEYLWRPTVLDSVRNSTIVAARTLVEARSAGRLDNLTATAVLGNMLAITDATPDELAYLVASTRNLDQLDYYLGEMVSRRALLGWSTHGHTGVDVNLYAYGLDAAALAGNHENTDIGEFIRTMLQLDLGSVTEQLSGLRLRPLPADSVLLSAPHDLDL